MADTSTLKQLRETYPWLWSTPQSYRWGSRVPAGWLPIMAELCERMAAIVSDDAQHRGVVIDQLREKWGFLGIEWRARGRGGPVERDDDPEVAAQIEKVVSAAQERSKRACAVCGRPRRLRRGGWIMTLCDAHAALHAAGEIPPGVLEGERDDRK